MSGSADKGDVACAPLSLIFWPAQMLPLFSGGDVMTSSFAAVSLEYADLQANQT